MTLPPAVWILAALLLACVASFGWAMRRFFVKPAGTTPGMQFTKSCGVVFTLVHLAAILLSRAVPLNRLVGAISLYVAALLLFWWTWSTNRGRPLTAVFSPDRPGHLVTSGPYRLVRHPFYCSYLLMWFAGVV